MNQTKLQTASIASFVLPIITTVGLVGYLSFKNGERAIEQLAQDIQLEVKSRIDRHLDSYLATPVRLIQTNVDAYELGILDVFNFQKTGQYFRRQLQVFNVSYINFASTKDEYIGAGDYGNGKFQIKEIPLNQKNKSSTYNTDEAGKRLNLASVQDFNPHAEAWYSDAIKADRLVWSEIYNWDTNPEIMSIAASYPIRDRDRHLIAEIGVDLRLSHISNFLHQLRIGKTGKALILERSGLLVASSVKEPPCTINNEQTTINKQQLTNNKV